MTKSTKIALAIALALGAISPAWSATTGDIVLNVNATCAEAITVAATDGPDVYEFGDVAINASTQTTRSYTVTNTGTCGDTWELSVVDDGGWSEGSSAAHDTYAMMALFNLAMPDSGDFAGADDSLTGSAVACDGSKFTGSDDCQNVTAESGSNSSLVWFRLDMPVTISGAAGAKQFTVTLTTNP